MSAIHSASNFSEQKVFTPDGSPQAWLGSAVAILGNTAFIGAKNSTVNGRLSQGAVYVFEKIDGAWKQVQKLTAHDGAAGDQFGLSIALAGDLAIITAPYAAIDGRIWQGAAYVFRKSEKGWAQIQKILASTAKAFDTFGMLVRMSSSWAFIAAGGATRAGQTIPYRVFAFRLVPAKPGDTWSERSILNAPDPSDLTNAFGSSIALSGSTVLIGSRTATLNGQPGQGAAYIYTYRNPGGWSLATRLTAEDGASRDNFGVSVAFDGKEALIGAHGATVDGNVSQGAVYRFNLRRGAWEQTQKILARGGTAINLFGASVNLSRHRLLVGAYAVDNYRGAAYMFALKDGMWQPTKILRASDGASGDVFGYYSALSETDAVVGAYAATINGHQKQGAAYFYALPQASWEDG